MIPLNTVKKSRINIFLNNLMLTSPVTSNTFLLWYFDFTSGFHINSVDTGRKLNVHKMFRRRSGRLLNVLCSFNLRPVSTGLKTFDWVLITPLCNSKTFPADIYLLKVNSRNTRTRYEICSELTIKTPERRQVSLLLALNIFHTLF